MWLNADQTVRAQGSNVSPRGMTRAVIAMVNTISFRVVKESYGWSVRLGDGMTTPFQSHPLALKHANGFAEALRRHGEFAEVVVEEPDQQAFTPTTPHSGSRP